MNVLTPTADYKVIYKDIHDTEGLSLIGYIYSPPSFIKTGPFLLSEIGDGYYYLEVDFTILGTYIIKIENETEAYRVINMAKEASVQNIEDLLKATVVFNKTNNKLSFYRDSARTQLIIEFQINDISSETSKTRL